MIRTIALAYSGGLDTSIIVPWLKERYGARVICVAADIGQGSELDGVRAKAIASGAEECYVEDLRQEFVEKFVWPTLRAGAIYGRKYLLGTSMGRPLIARRQVEIAPVHPVHLRLRRVPRVMGVGEAHPAEEIVVGTDRVEPLDRPVGGPVGVVPGARDRVVLRLGSAGVAAGNRGEQIAEGTVSLAYRLAFRHRERTLTDEEVGRAMAAIFDALRARGWRTRDCIA